MRKATADTFARGTIVKKSPVSNPLDEFCERRVVRSDHLRTKNTPYSSGSAPPPPPPAYPIERIPAPC